MLPIHTALWPLFYTGRMQACALVGTHAVQLGDCHATDDTTPGIQQVNPRNEAITVYRVAFTTASEILPEDPPVCGFLNQAAFELELQRQKPGVGPDDVVTIVYFRRRMEDRGGAG